MSVDKDGIVCQVFDVAVYLESIAHTASFRWAYVAAVRKSSVIYRNNMIPQTPQSLV